MSRKDKFNSSGCLDMTAYLAMRNIRREEAARRHSLKAYSGRKPLKAKSVPYRKSG